MVNHFLGFDNALKMIFFLRISPANAKITTFDHIY